MARERLLAYFAICTDQIIMIRTEEGVDSQSPPLFFGLPPPHRKCIWLASFGCSMQRLSLYSINILAVCSNEYVSWFL